MLKEPSKTSFNYLIFHKKQINFYLTVYFVLIYSENYFTYYLNLFYFRNWNIPD